MEPIGPGVARELRRHGPQAGMGALLEAWPDAVGPQIARNAWPARIARDGTVHVATADAIWAFELGHRATEIAGRLGVGKLRFAPGPLPERRAEPERARSLARAEPSPEQVEQAAQLAAAVTDDELRERIARAASLSLARTAASGPLRAPSVGSF